MLLQAAQRSWTSRFKPAATFDRPYSPVQARHCPHPRHVGVCSKISICSAQSKSSSSPPGLESTFKPEALRLLPLLPLLLAFPAQADNINYAPGAGADVVKSLGGLLYVALLAYWLYIIIGRRVKRAQTERLATRAKEEEEDESEAETAEKKEVTATAAALGALQAGFFTYLLFLLGNSISSFFVSQELPDQFTAKNITVTIRTAVGGLAWLATFIFGMNTVGLSVLAVQLAINPESEGSAAKGSKQPKKDDSVSS